MITSRQLKQLQRRDERVLSLVIDTYGPWVKAICYQIVAPIAGASAADECVNDVFLRIWTKADTFSGTPDEFRAWVGRMAKHRAIDTYRYYQRQLDREALYDDVPDVARARDEEETIEPYVRALSPTDQRIFRMKYEQGYSNEDIAHALDMTRASIDNRLYRGRQKIAAQLERSESHEQMG